MGWDGMGWDGMGWDGMGWDGMGWDGMGRDGTGWDGMGWDGTGDNLSVKILPWHPMYCFSISYVVFIALECCIATNFRPRSNEDAMKNVPSGVPQSRT